jgi:hypothetical protein
MMKRQIVIFGMILFLTIKTDVTCDCNYKGPFLEMSKQTPLVALIKVSKYLTFKDIYHIKTPMSMEVELIEVYKGTESRKTVTVWGDNGNLCRPYLSEFKEGQYYLIAFNIDKKNQMNTEYAISSCGTYWLNVDFINSLVSGDINSKDRTNTTISLEQIKSQLKTNQIL